MSRLTFYFLKENADGNITLDRNIDTTNLAATKDGAAYSTTFYSNNNGTYWFAASGSGEYDLKYNGTTQDEFKQIWIPDSDTLTESDIDETTVRLNGDGKLEIVNAGSIVRQSDIVDNLSSTSVIAPLSANQGRVLSASIALKQDETDTPLTTDDVIDDFSTGGSDKVQSAESLVLDLSGTAYLSSMTTYNAAIREIDRRLGLITIGGTYNSYLPFGRNAAFTQASNLTEMFTIDGATNTRGYRMPAGGTISGISLVANCTSFSKGGCEDDATLKCYVYKNGVLQTLGAEVEIAATGIKTASSTAVTVAFSAGDQITCKISFVDGGGDAFSISDFAVLVQVRE